jgi:hypothetical protein
MREPIPQQPISLEYAPCDAEKPELVPPERSAERSLL